MAVTVYKRRGSRNLKLSVNAHGVRVTIPAWAPYKAGVDFARSRQSWIADQRPAPRLLSHDQAIGKSHHLYFEPTGGQIIRTRVSDIAVTVKHPVSLSSYSPAVQQAAAEAAIRALRKQAEKLLPQRLAYLAGRHGLEYRAVSVKRLKGRWGSCDQHGNIVLNLFLMRLPWPLIDYVLLHELTHTRVLRHGPVFWDEMAKLMPDVKTARREIKRHHPVLNG